MDAGLAAEGAHRKARVVREDGATRELVEGLGLDEGILEKSLAILDHVKAGMSDVDRTEEAVAGKEFGKLAELVGVAGGYDDFHAERIAAEGRRGKRRWRWVSRVGSGAGEARDSPAPPSFFSRNIFHFRMGSRRLR